MKSQIITITIENTGSLQRENEKRKKIIRILDLPDDVIVDFKEE